MTRPIFESDAQLLRDAIEKSGLSARKFAAQVLIRDERTVRRWLGGEAVPQVVVEFLKTYEGPEA